ncbi:MAG TPA: hypothetical protein VGC99_12965 [Candidatus Tectomicrobia bacterium]
MAAAFGHRRHARLRLTLVGRGVTVAWFAEGDEEAGSQDGPSAWPGSQEGAVGMVLGARCAGVVEGLDGVHGDAQLAHECLHEAGLGAMRPSSVVSGVARLMARMRWSMTSTSRT